MPAVPQSVKRFVGSNQNSGAAVYTYVYDRFGNRWQQNGPFTFLATFTGNSPGAPANNNRMDGYSYDAAGNLLSDRVHSYSYDAENRITQVDGGATAFYVYDALGRRVEKSSTTKNECSTTGGTVFYAYDLAGHTSVFTQNGVNSCHDEIFAGSRHLATYAGGTLFNHSDWLGTERVRSWYGGTGPGELCTSLPFGDGLNCGAISDPGPTASPLHFTGKERDVESGLDNFGARYNSSQYGRFMSPDPENIDAILHDHDPQSWNGYAYARNNPLLYTDPDGLNHLVCVYDGKNCADLTNEQYNQFRKDNPNLRVTPSGDIYTINENGTETKIGSETYYNEKDADAAAHIAASQLLINEFMKQMAYNAVGGYVGGRLVGLGLDALEAANAARAAAQAANAGRSAAVELTGHAAVRLAQRGITQAVVDEAVQTAEATGQVTSKVGQYGTVQNIYKGTNGITVIVETEGRNAGKVITAFQTGSKP